MRRFAFLLAFTVALSWGAVLPAPAAEDDRPSVESDTPSAEQKKGGGRWGRDPFVFPASSEKNAHLDGADETQRPLSLTAIIYRDGNGAAIINDRIVRKGDRVEGMEVEEISSDRVLLRNRFRSLELKVQSFLSK